MICRFDEIKSLKIEEIIAQGEQEEFKEYEKKKEIWLEISGKKYDKEFSPSKTVCFTINKKQINPDNLEQLKTLAHQAKNMGYTIHIIVEQSMHTLTPQDPEIYTYTPQEMRVLIDFNEQLSNLDIKSPIRFSECITFTDENALPRIFTINDVINANSNIDKVVEHIKSQNLSPFEAMLYIHTYITRNFLYKANKSHPEVSRSIAGIYKDNSIICYGYATLTKAIIDKLDLPELKCSLLSEGVYDKDLRKKHRGEHAQCLIQISDRKYDIQGYYLEDSTWDSKTKELTLGRGYARCLFPVEDILHFKDSHIAQEFLDHKDFFSPTSLNSGPIAHYVRALKTPEVVKKHKKQSPPIPFEKYYDALCHVIAPQMPEVEIGNISAQDWTKRMLKRSHKVAKIVFDKKATNCFSNINAENFSSDSQSTL